MSRAVPDGWIGMDESGKGDYFGPLVAAVYLAIPRTSYQILAPALTPSLGPLRQASVTVGPMARATKTGLIKTARAGIIWSEFWSTMRSRP
jgi:hypothetical protein